MRSEVASIPIRHGGIFGKTSLYLATRPLLTQHDRTAIIEAYDVELVLPNMIRSAIAFCAAVHGHCVLLVRAPLASLSLAGQEHGRTIPLADISSEHWSAGKQTHHAGRDNQSHRGLGR